MRDTISLGDAVLVTLTLVDGRVVRRIGHVAAVDRWQGYTEVLVSEAERWYVYDAATLSWDDAAGRWVAPPEALRGSQP